MEARTAQNVAVWNYEQLNNVAIWKHEQPKNVAVGVTQHERMRRRWGVGVAIEAEACQQEGVRTSGRAPTRGGGKIRTSTGLHCSRRETPADYSTAVDKPNVSRWSVTGSELTSFTYRAKINA